VHHLTDDDWNDDAVTANNRLHSHAQLAKDITQYIATKGSPVKLLAFSPTTPHYDKLETADSNGHIYPDYYYVKGNY